MVAERILAGESFIPSENPYDWLGRGVYFWEYGPDRALRFAEEQCGRGRIQKPAVVGALIQLSSCIDLFDTEFTSQLSGAFDEFKNVWADSGQPMPQNRGRTADLLLRELDCAVMNFFVASAEARGVRIDTIRAGFEEGPAAFPGSQIRSQTHIQLVVRNPACILGVFSPR